MVRSAYSRPFGSASSPFESPWIHIRRILNQCISATRDIYCLRQVHHQVSEPPNVLQAFLFLHILTIIYLCLSIALKRIHLDPHPWRSLFVRVGAHLCFCPCLSGPPSRCLGGLFNQQVFWKENGFWHASAATAANLKIYPAGAQNFSPSPQHTTNIHHLFRLFCDQSVTRGAFGQILVSFGYRFGYRSARAPSLPATCVRD